MLLEFARAILRIPPPKIDRAAAEEIAREVCRRCEWRSGKLVAEERLKTWHVVLDPDVIPERWIEIDNQTGNVKGRCPSGLTGLMR